MTWTKYHVILLIPTYIIEIVVAIILGKVLKNKDEKIRMIPIQVVTIILLALEVAKQLYGIIKGYDLYWIPLHFCSLFLFIMPVVSFYNGKYKNQARVLGVVISSCLFLFMVVYPDIVFGGAAIQASWDYLLGRGGRFIELHSVLFHIIAVGLFFLFLALDLVEFNTKKDIILVLIAFAIYCVIVGPLSNIIDVNFNNFARCNAPFLEDVRLSLNDSLKWVGQVIYVLMISVGTLVVPTLAYLTFRGADKLIKKISCHK